MNATQGDDTSGFYENTGSTIPHLSTSKREFQFNFNGFSNSLSESYSSADLLVLPQKSPIFLQSLRCHRRGKKGPKPLHQSFELTTLF